MIVYMYNWNYQTIIQWNIVTVYAQLNEFFDLQKFPKNNYFADRSILKHLQFLSLFLALKNKNLIPTHKQLTLPQEIKRQMHNYCVIRIHFEWKIDIVKSMK